MTGEPLWHVTSSLNRASIQTYGLDVTLMGAARGIAGSTAPENDGVHLCVDASEADYFVRMNNTGGPVDVWEVTGVDRDLLVDNGTGYEYLPGTISRAHMCLARRDVEPVEREWDVAPSDSSSAYSSTLTITFDDGAVLCDEQAREYLEG